MIYGLTPEGFATPTLVVIREGLEASLRNVFGASLALGDKSILGQITGILAERLASLWEQLEAVNSSQDPDKASGAGLEALCAMTGTFRPAATYSMTNLVLTGTPLTLVLAGNKAKTSSTGQKFLTRTNATIAALTAWAGSTAYALGARVANGGRAYQCTTSGVSAAAGGPSTEMADITDGTAHWTYLGPGAGAVDVSARAEVTGPVVAVARDIREIDTPVGGWEGVVNLLDASPGRDVAQDGELRLLREQELSAGGNGTLDALRAELLRLPDVVAVTIFQNPMDVTDPDGVPPHNVEAMVRMPVGTDYDQRVFDALLAGVAAGVGTHGTTVGLAKDSEGTTHVVKFSRPVEVPIYVELNVIVDPAAFPVDGVAQIKQLIADWGNAKPTGTDAVASAIAARAFFVPGMLDVTTTLIDVAPGPSSGATVSISKRQLATYDTSRISIITTPGVP
ncbi:MAG: hypothetical protein ACTHU0_25775 [Kofleriaceae bacterium]